MMSKAQNIEKYDFNSKDKLFLDTNIWLFNFFPQNPTDKRIESYSIAFSKIIDAKCHIYIDVLVISEFINTCARARWKLIAEDKSFKQFRNSNAFKDVSNEIADYVRRILKHSSRIESGLEELEIGNLIDEYGAGKSDFNDQIILSLCQRKGFILITDDGDFRGKNIKLLTANTKLLR